MDKHERWMMAVMIICAVISIISIISVSVICVSGGHSMACIGANCRCVDEIK